MIHCSFICFLYIHTVIQHIVFHIRDDVIEYVGVWGGVARICVPISHASAIV